MSRLSFLVLVSVAISLPSPDAEACGGFFCNSGPTQTTVINQNSERIVFVRGEDTVEAYIQIRYEGDPVDFAWVVPVIARPELDVADPGIFDAFDQATAPTFIFPPPPGSGGGGGGGGGFGCAASEGRASASFDDGGGDGDGDADGDVQVWGMDNVGPYATAIVSADDSSDLTTWLEDHDYAVPEEAHGIIGQYVEEGFFFVAIRLNAAAGTDLIQPLVIRYAGTEPCVPLRLTQVAAVPDLGVLVWIISDDQAIPYNYARSFVDERLVVLNQDGTTNYLDLVSQSVDSSGGGRAFVTEFAMPTENVPDLSQQLGGYYSYVEGSVEAEEIVRSGRYLTRLYTEIDPQEMTLDPIFIFDPDLADVSNVHDLTQPDATAGIAAPRSSRLASMLPALLPIGVAAVFFLRRRKR